MKRLFSLIFMLLSMITLVGCSGTKEEIKVPEEIKVSEEKKSNNNPNLMKSYLKKRIYYHLKMKNK